MDKLEIYKKALDLVFEIYTFTRNNKILAKDYSLIDQLRRASISIVANIAEGYGRGKKHFTSYLMIASGSANEIIALLQITHRVYGIETLELQESFRILGKRIHAFSKSLFG